MTLLAILLALGAERLMSGHRAEAVALRDTASGLIWARMPLAIRRSALTPWLAVAGLGAALWLLIAASASELVELLLGALLLWRAFGPRDLADDVQRLRAARSGGDAETVARLTRALHAGPSPDADHRSLLGALFIQSHERRFAPCLWFLALGPAGALGYRLAGQLPLLADTPEAIASATRLHALLAWLPTRLTALLFGLAGSLDDAIDAFRRVHEEPLASPDGWQRRSFSLLAEAACAALDWEDAPDSGPMIASSLDATLAEVLRMETRATLIALALVALFTTGAWLA